VARVKIAVVIPALDEADEVEGAVSSARAEEVEVIVVDGGSRDDTRDRARDLGARVLRTERGRARQLQCGLEASQSDVVLFLHADTRLPKGWDDAVRRALCDPTVAGGAFRLRFDDESAAIRAVEWGARLRSAWLGLPFGDQALFARRSVLVEIGGVPDVPVMEDLDLVRAIKARGRLSLLALPATTSARRFRARGVVRTSLSHALATLAWGLGMDRGRLATWLGR
jgi:rSAM/selenodomain-associated transferase 2